MSKYVIEAAAKLARAYAYAKNGDARNAGRLLVEASEDGNLDEVMDGVASGVEQMEDDMDDDMFEQDASFDEDDYQDADDMDDDTVEIPASVARLASRTRV